MLTERPGGLFRRHVADRSHDLPLCPHAREVGRQPEIEQDHTALERDQHIGRFDVAMQLSSLVKGADSLGQLPECRRAAAARQSGSSARPAAGVDSVELRAGRSVTVGSAVTRLHAGSSVRSLT